MAEFHKCYGTRYGNQLAGKLGLIVEDPIIVSRPKTPQAIRQLLILRFYSNGTCQLSNFRTSLSQYFY